MSRLYRAVMSPAISCSKTKALAGICQQRQGWVSEHVHHESRLSRLEPPARFLPAALATPIISCELPPITRSESPSFTFYQKRRFKVSEQADLNLDFLVLISFYLESLPTPHRCFSSSSQHNPRNHVHVAIPAKSMTPRVRNQPSTPSAWLQISCYSIPLPISR